MSKLKELINKFQETATLNLKRPKNIDETLFYQSLASKRQYIESWDTWVGNIAIDFETSFDEAEEACIRGIKKSCDLAREEYGNLQADWLVDYLEMQELFKEVSLEEK